MSLKPGFESALQALRGLDPAGRERLLNTMADSDPELVEQLRAALFDFKDIATLPLDQIRKLTDAINDQTWALAFRNQEDEVRSAVYSQMTSRRAEGIKTLIDNLGPQPLSKVQEAQADILKLIES